MRWVGVGGRTFVQGVTLFSEKSSNPAITLLSYILARVEYFYFTTFHKNTGLPPTTTVGGQNLPALVLQSHYQDSLRIQQVAATVFKQ